MGSRRTRRERRARKRRARQQELAGTVAGTGGRFLWRVLGGAWIVASLVGVFVAAFAGEDGLIIFFCLSAALVYGLLWLGESWMR